MSEQRPPRLFRALLALLPISFRRAYGEEMEEQIRVMLAPHPGLAGLPRRLLIWLHVGFDIVARAPELYRREELLERRRAAAYLPSDFTDGSMRDSLSRDIGYALRGLLRNPEFALVAVLTLALGIGSATTIFSVVNGVLMQPLPYRTPDRLVNIWNDLGDGAQSLPAVSALDFRDYRTQTTLFEDFAAGSGGGVVGAQGIVTGEGPSEKVSVSPVTANFFPMLGVEPMLGRNFTDEEEHVNGPDVAILSHGLWQRRFGSDRDIVGKTILLDGVSQTVVGVLPPSFHLLLPAEAFLIRDAEIWLPLQFDYANAPPRNYTGYTVFGRLKPGVTVEQAQREMDGLATRFRAQFAEHASSNLRIRVVPLHHDIVKGVRPTLLVLLAAVGVVVLIACANVANLLLARASARQRELSIRIAMGATRWQIARQMMTESLVLALLGGVFGMAIAVGGLAVLDALQPANLPRLSNVRVDWTVLGFTAAICVVTALLFGLAPALYGARSGVGDVLKAGGRVANHGRQGLLRNMLVVVEVALSLVLLIGAGLLVRSFSSLQQVRPGFDPENALTFQIDLPRTGYRTLDARVNFFRELEGRLRALPGVTTVGGISQLPLTGSGPLAPYAYNEETSRNWESVTADGRGVTPGFFAAMGTRLVSGRDFTNDDVRGRAPIVIIDESLAKRAFAGIANPVGRQLQVGPVGEENNFATVVGIVEHIRMHDLGAERLPHIYRPYYGAPFGGLNLVVRSTLDPAVLAPSVRRVVAELDKQLPVNDLVPMSHYVSRGLASARFTLILMQVVGAMALFLSAIGIYGVISYAVGQRTKEFGVRMALGQTPAGLRLAVVMQGFRLIALSIAVGLVTASLTTRLLGSMLYDVSPRDPLTFALVALFLMVVALVACYVPARRASRVDPLMALRAE